MSCWGRITLPYLSLRLVSCSKLVPNFAMAFFFFFWYTLGDTHWETHTGPCGGFSADAVAVQTDVGVTLLKQGQHLPCGAVVSSSYWSGKGRGKIMQFWCVCVCVAMALLQLVSLGITHVFFLLFCACNTAIMHRKGLRKCVRLCLLWKWVSVSRCTGSMTFC